MSQRVAVVTGGNRGLGFATVRKLCKTFNGTVYLTARNAFRGMAAVKRLKRVNCYPVFWTLNVGDRHHRLAFADYIKQTHGGLDVLVNNAAVRFFTNTSADDSFRVRATLHTNFYSVLFLCQLLFPMLRPHARVVNLGSSCGHLSDLPGPMIRNKFLRRDFSLKDLRDMLERYKVTVQIGVDERRGWGNDSYCVSKVAVAALTFLQQAGVNRYRPEDDIVVNCFCPGDVHTSKTNFAGHMSPERLAENIVKLATLPDHVTSPVGQFVWHDMTVVAWNGTKPGGHSCNATEPESSGN